MRRLRKMSRTGNLAYERVVADRAAAQMRGGVGDDGPDVLAERGAEQHQVAVLGLAEDPAWGAGDRARAPVARLRLPRAQVDRGEARERLARQRAGEPQRGEAGRDVERAGGRLPAED